MNCNFEYSVSFAFVHEKLGCFQWNQPNIWWANSRKLIISTLWTTSSQS